MCGPTSPDAARGQIRTNGVTHSEGGVDGRPKQMGHRVRVSTSRRFEVTRLTGNLLYIPLLCGRHAQQNRGHYHDPPSRS